ncbi:MAG: YlzJ-like family protein [Firmicutes bacterium]|nr:YlzJ-like family protein [Bacillota bacterium]
MGEPGHWPPREPGAGLEEWVVRGSSGPVRLWVEREPGGGRLVSRLASSDPFDYLDPRFAPGRRLGGPT